jgi:type I restriction enzyme, S subunit
MSRWPIIPLKGHISEVSLRKGETNAEVLSVTNTNGFVRSLDVFDKQVFSQDTSNYKLVKFNDIAYNPSRINVGSVARCHLHDGGAISPMYVVVRCRESLLPQYLLYFLRSDIGLQHINHRCVGAVRVQLRYTDLEEIEIPVPPLQHQERIIRILDEAEELRRLRAESDRRTAEVIPALFQEMFGTPNKTWPVAKFSELGTLDRGKSKHRPRNESSLFGGPYPFVQTGDIANCRGRVESYSQTYSELGLAQSKLWPEGTLCITIAANIAKCAVLTFPACFPDSVVGFIPNEHISIEFVRSWLETLEAKLEEEAPQAAQKNINLQILRSLELHVPPVDLQREFDDSVADIHTFETDQAKGKHRLDDLFQSLLYRAFHGDL